MPSLIIVTMQGSFHKYRTSVTNSQEKFQMRFFCLVTQGYYVDIALLGIE